MFDQYLVTGATGFLGRAVAEELVCRRAQVHALVLRDDPYIHLLPNFFVNFFGRGSIWRKWTQGNAIRKWCSSSLF